MKWSEEHKGLELRWAKTWHTKGAMTENSAVGLR